MSFLLAAQQGPERPFSLTAEHTPSPVLFLKQSGFISIWQWPPISFCPSGCSLSATMGSALLQTVFFGSTSLLGVYI